MIYYERVYVEVERKGEKSMWVDSTRSRGIDREHVLQYMQAKRKTLICGMAFLIFLFGTPLVAFIVGLIRGDRIEGPVLLGLFIAGELVVCFFLVRSLLRRYRSLSPEDETCVHEAAPDALDWYLKKKHHLKEKHDMIAAASVLDDKAHYIGSSINSSSIRWIHEKKIVAEAILQYTRTPGNDPALLKGRYPGDTASAPQANVVDLRSAREREIERNAGTPLQPEREKLAQEMTAYLKTHDTGNNMEHYREFRTLFHDRSEKIAEDGGYHQALQEIYYRIRQLCAAQGVDFHSGAVDHVFEGEYWRS